MVLLDEAYLVDLSESETSTLVGVGDVGVVVVEVVEGSVASRSPGSHYGRRFIDSKHLRLLGYFVREWSKTGWPSRQGRERESW